MIVLSIVLIMVAAIVSAVAVPEDLQDRAVEAYPLVTVAGAGTVSAGTHVRVEGTIVEAPGGVAVVGNLEDCGKTDCWVFTWSPFVLWNGNATLQVETSGTSDPNVWGHAPDFSQDSNQQEWVVGESIAVEGTVETPGSSPVVAANGVGASANAFWSPIDDEVAYVSLGSLLAGVAAFTVYYVATHRKVLLHRKTVQSATNPFAPKIEADLTP